MTKLRCMSVLFSVTFAVCPGISTFCWRENARLCVIVGLPSCSSTVHDSDKIRTRVSVRWLGGEGFCAITAVDFAPLVLELIPRLFEPATNQITAKLPLRRVKWWLEAVKEHSAPVCISELMFVIFLHLTWVHADQFVFAASMNNYYGCKLLYTCRIDWSLT